MQRVYLGVKYLVNLSEVILDEEIISIKMCLYMELIDGSVAQAHVVGPTHCRSSSKSLCHAHTVQLFSNLE